MATKKAQKKVEKIYATGKRKTAIAKVWLTAGSGKLSINGVSLDTWLGGHEAIKMRVLQPLRLTKQENAVDITANALGGGYSAQADALRHGISKALTLFDKASFRPILKPCGLLTRDARVVERKKYGKHKARRSPQFSKR
ncbi:MAG: 30S ribosomal protein S9 [Helicobacteraceae bacterium]|jgi:small subunit ribosomal protein S9|nr:30S ribosomal protein S9 [Helicobacteraceae bacterium]